MQRVPKNVLEVFPNYFVVVSDEGLQPRLSPGYANGDQGQGLALVCHDQLIMLLKLSRLPWLPRKATQLVASLL